MTFTIPDKGTAQNDLQSILFSGDLDIVTAGIDAVDCVLSGGAVTAQGSPNMTVAVAKAAVMTNGVLKAVAANASVTISAANATFPRLDLVVIDSTGAIQVRAGTAAANPKPPARTANDVVLAIVYVPANDTTISSDQIVDKRMTHTQGPITLQRTVTNVTFNNTLAIQTYATITIPSGLFLTGKVIRLRCGGNYLANSGTPTWTLTIAYGGTTMFADVTAATVAGAARGGWGVDFNLIAKGSTSQLIDGVVTFQTPAAKAAPTTGTAGDLAVTTTVVTPFEGTAAVDSDAADRVLTVQWTMSVNNAADETVCNFVTVELV